MEIIAIVDLYIQIQQFFFYTNQLHYCFVLKLEDKAMISLFNILLKTNWETFTKTFVPYEKFYW